MVPNLPVEWVCKNEGVGGDGRGINRRLHTPSTGGLTLIAWHRRLKGILVTEKSSMMLHCSSPSSVSKSSARGSVTLRVRRWWKSGCKTGGGDASGRSKGQKAPHVDAPLGRGGINFITAIFFSA